MGRRLRKRLPPSPAISPIFSPQQQPQIQTNDAGVVSVQAASSSSSTTNGIDGQRSVALKLDKSVLSPTSSSHKSGAGAGAADASDNAENVAATQPFSATRTVKGRCPIESHLAFRGQQSTSRIRTSDVKKRDKKLSSNQRAFLDRLASQVSPSASDSDASSTTATTSTTTAQTSAATSQPVQSSAVGATATSKVAASKPHADMAASSQICQDAGTLANIQKLRQGLGSLSRHGNSSEPSKKQQPNPTPQKKLPQRTSTVSLQLSKSKEMEQDILNIQLSPILSRKLAGSSAKPKLQTTNDSSSEVAMKTEGSLPVKASKQKPTGAALATRHGRASPNASKTSTAKAASAATTTRSKAKAATKSTKSTRKSKNSVNRGQGAIFSNCLVLGVERRVCGPSLSYSRSYSFSC